MVVPTVTMDIKDGLGNQMFQYAAGKAMALRTGARLLLNTRWFSLNGLRSYSLSMFGLPEQCIDIPTPHIHRWQKQLNRIFPLNLDKIVVNEPHFHYWEKFASLQPDVHLHGTWASPRYFAGYEQHIRRAFAFPDSPASEIAALEARMRSAPSVSVHLRRGDYMIPEVAEFFGTLGPEYYNHAGEVMARMVPGCCFFVFSDDPAAARDFFKEWKDAVFVETGSQRDDLRLMSCCRHHIIANSTYSWWGAWLAGNDSGVVIAPRYWFSRETLLGKFVLDLIPETWIIL